MDFVRRLHVLQSIGHIYRNERALSVVDWVPAHGSCRALETFAEGHPLTSTSAKLWGYQRDSCQDELCPT